MDGWDKAFLVAATAATGVLVYKMHKNELANRVDVARIRANASVRCSANHVAVAQCPSTVVENNGGRIMW